MKEMIDDLGGMIEFRPGHELGKPADIGDQDRGVGLCHKVRLCLRKIMQYGKL
jgi:hypothetical protein